MTRSRTSNRAHLAFLSLAAVLAVLFAIVLSPSRVLAATISVNPGSITSHTCDSTEWHFVITQLANDAQAPVSIHVTWEGGVTADVPLEDVDGHTAHYFFFGNLNLAVVSATAVIDDSWSGTFNLSHGPCGTPTPTNTPENTPENTPTNTPTEEISTETPTVGVTETVGGEEETPIPTNTPVVGVTETVGGEEETPVPTEVPVEELPSTGSAPDGKATTGMLAALVLAVLLAGMSWLVRLQSKHAKR